MSDYRIQRVAFYGKKDMTDIYEANKRVDALKKDHTVFLNELVTLFDLTDYKSDNVFEHSCHLTDNYFDENNYYYLEFMSKWATPYDFFDAFSKKFSVKYHFIIESFDTGLFLKSDASGLLFPENYILYGVLNPEKSKNINVNIRMYNFDHLRMYNCANHKDYHSGYNIKLNIYSKAANHSSMGAAF